MNKVEHNKAASTSWEECEVFFYQNLEEFTISMNSI